MVERDAVDRCVIATSEATRIPRANDHNSVPTSLVYLSCLLPVGFAPHPHSASRESSQFRITWR